MNARPLIGIERHRLGRDGRGVTTLVAFHGCTLRCKYCLNRQCLEPDGVWKAMTPSEVYDYVSMDELYFLATQGGVCFGGGEPALQVDFIREFKALCGSQWRTTIETAMNVPESNIQQLLPLIDEWIVDIKDMRNDVYEAYTGRNNALVLTNLRQLASHGAEVTIRVPIIPHFNTEDDVQGNILLLKEMGFKSFNILTYDTEDK